jgi:uncharacterized protein YraI
LLDYFFVNGSLCHEAVFEWVELAITKQMSANHLFGRYATPRNILVNTPAQSSQNQHNQNRGNFSRLTPIRLCLFLLLSILLLTGCGPEEGPSESDLTAETIRIAQEYQQSGDLGNARAQLEQLDVANPTQFLIFLAEDRADTAPGTAETNALVNLALAFGVQSGQLMAYAMQNGLLANSAPPTPQQAAQQVPPVISVEQAPAQQPTADSAPANVPAVVVVNATPAASEPGSSEPDSSETENSNSEQDGTQTDAQNGADQPAAEQTPAAEVALPTATPAPPTAAPVTKPQVQASNALNVRSGPGLAYPIVAALNTGEQAEILAKNPEGDWWQVALPAGGTGWVFGQLVTTAGDTAAIAIASDIPAPPPTPTPAPIAEAPTPAPEQPAESPPAEAAPTEAPPPADLPPGNDFYAVERRLWTVQETGGAVDSGGSVRCGEKRELHVIVLDANGNRLNGVAVQAIYGAQEIYVTGSQGKGDGQSEFVLGEGQGVKIIRDADGREVTSDVIDGMTTHSPKISLEDLIAAGYCRDKESCDKFNFSAGCWGHHSWTVTFKRRY